MTRIRQLWVDSSLLSDTDCSTAALMRHHHKLVSQRTNYIFKAGHAVHAALELHFGRASQREVMARLEADYKKYALSHVPAKDARSWPNVEATMRHYLETKPLVSFPFRVPSKNLIELGFTYPLCEWRGIPIMFAGRYDLLGQVRQSDAWCFIDHKTTSKSPAQALKEYETSAQISGYYWVAERTLKRIETAFINIVHLRDVPKSNRKCPTHKMQYESCGKLHSEHATFSVRRTPRELKEWHRSASALAKKFARLCTRYPELTDIQKALQEGMHYYGRCGYCDYRDFCRHGRRHQTVPQRFTKSDWDPRAYAKSAPSDVKKALKRIV